MQVESGLNSLDLLKTKLNSLGFKAFNNQQTNSYLFTWESKIEPTLLITTGVLWEIGENDSILSPPHDYSKIGILKSMDYLLLHVIIHPSSYSVFLCSNNSILQIAQNKLSKFTPTTFITSEKKAPLIDKRSKKTSSKPDSDGIKSIFNQWADKISDYKLLSSIFAYSNLIVQKDHCLNEEMIFQIFGRDSIIHHVGIQLLSEYYNTTSKDCKEIIETNVKSWEKMFVHVYEQKELIFTFYLNHTYYSILLANLLYKTQFNSHAITGYLDSGNLRQLQSAYQKLDFIIDFNDAFKWGYDCKDLLKFLHLFIPKLSYKDEDLFGMIYQDLISTFNRQASGEFYSPKELISLMIERKMNSHHTKFLDPACGSGSFLVEILRKLNSSSSTNNQNINLIKLYGIDINPLAVLTTQVNISLYAEQYGKNLLKNSQFPSVSIYNDNALFPTNKDLLQLKVNFIIGNPPWVNISGLYSDEYKIQIKRLANQLNLLLPVEAKNTELCAIFFYQTRELYLEKNGDVFLILPASVLNGRQYVFFRSFMNFSNVEAWFFDQDLFKIHSICLFAENDKITEDPSLKPIKSTSFKVNSRENRLEFKQLREDVLKPIYVKWDKSNPKVPMVGKFNPIDLKDDGINDIIPSISPYYSLVKGGLRIVPRRWMIIKNNPPFKSIERIYPDIEQDSKPTWSQTPYESYEVEKESLHPFFKSDAIIPFTFIQIEHAFLPLTNPKSVGESEISHSKNPKGQEFFSISLMPEKSRALFQLMDDEYQKRMKSSASMANLTDNLTFNSRLIPTTYFFSSPKHVMVVHNSIGSIVKAAVIRVPIILDNSLYFFLTDNEDEAYYIAGILNSSVMTQLVKKIGSTGSRGSLRNIHKNPYNFPIAKFESDEDQTSIAEIAKKMETYTLNFLLKNFGDSKVSTSQPITDKGIDSHFIQILLLKHIKESTKAIQKVLYMDKNYLDMRDKLDILVKLVLMKNKS
jgi:methylase of polypeptide subunit release factors